MTLPRPRNPIPDHWRDRTIAAAWLTALEIEIVTVRHHRGPLVLNMLVVASIALPAVWRRRAPLAYTAAVLASATALVAWLSGKGTNLAPIYVLTVVPYTAAKYGGRATALIGVAAVVAWATAVNAVTAPTAGNYLGTAATACVAWAAGRWLRARRLLNEELARTTERIEAERESRERLAVADERTRIARELHALIASNVSAMVVQAEAAALLLDADLRAADVAMAAVEHTGRDALSDMRRVLGVLRHSGDAPALAPQPGVGQLYALVEQARTSGRRIELRVEGEPGPLTASADLAIYRILEEALAGTAVAAAQRVDLRLRFARDDVELELAASGLSGSPPWPTLAMRERATICDGMVQSDSEANAWRLVVRLPRHFDEAIA